MGRTFFKLIFLVSLCIFTLTSLAVADDTSGEKDPPPDSSDIVGYRYDQNWWELGQLLDDMDLKGFESLVTNDPGIEVYIDSERPIWFGKDTIDSRVTLAFVDKQLALIVIRLWDAGEDFEEYSAYYSRRQKDCVQIEDSRERNCWIDKDNDTVTVQNQQYWLGCPSVPSRTVISYLRRHLVVPNPVEDLPPWVYFLVNGMGFEGP